MIKYTLLPNNLTDDGTFVASMRLGDALDLDAIIADMDERGTTVAESETRAVLIEFLRVIQRQVLAGRRVNLGGLVRLFPSIRGSFSGPEDSFDPERHEIALNAVADLDLKKKLRTEGSTEKLTLTGVQSILTRLYDHGLDTYDETLSPGRIATLIGDRLKFNPAEPDEGIFLINTADNVETKIDEAPHNQPKKILFLVPPDLSAASSFHLELRTRFQDSNKLRVQRFNNLLQTA